MESTFGLVEDNTFIGQTINGILVGVAPYSEGPGVEDVVFRGNRFSNVGSFPNTPLPPISGPDYGALVVAVQDNSGSETSPIPLHKNLIFDSNKFNDLQGPGLYLSRANNVVLTHNSFVNTNQRHLTFTNVDSDRLDGALIVSQSYNVFTAKLVHLP